MYDVYGLALFMLPLILFCSCCYVWCLYCVCIVLHCTSFHCRVFHILPDDTATSAVWVAQRVPDDHITVLANMFTIDIVDLTQDVSLLYSMSTTLTQ